MSHRASPLPALAVLAGLAAGLGEFITLQAWRVRDRLACTAAHRRLRP